MAGPAFVEQLKNKFGAKIAGANFENIDPWIEATPDGLLEVCRYLRDEPSLAFDYLNCISGEATTSSDLDKWRRQVECPLRETPPSEPYRALSMTLRHQGFSN